MHTKSRTHQQQQVLTELRILLGYQRAIEYHSDMLQLLMAYFQSDHADCKEERSHMAVVFVNLLDFFTSLDGLPEIDRNRN